MRNTKWFTGLLVLVMAISLLAGCGKSEKAPAASAPAAAEGIKIGVLYSTTGPFSISEKPMLNAAKLAIDEINAAGGILGATVKLSTKDDQGTPAEAVSGFNSLLSEGAAAIIGATLSSCTSAITSLADD